MTKRNTKNQKTAGVIFPPPFIYLTSIVAGIILNFIWNVKIFNNSKVYTGIILILLAVFIFVNAFKSLGKAKTPIQPYKPTSKIVKTGPYRLTRNPIYLSFALAQLGIALLLNNLWILIGLVPALLIVSYGVILREEKYLENKFGREYVDYKSSVRRWI